MSGVWLWQESPEVAQDGGEGANGATLAEAFIGENTGVTWSYSWFCLEVVGRAALVWSACC